MVKQIMQIIGMEIVKSSNEPDGSDGIVKVKLFPWSNVKVKKPSLMDLAMGGTEKILNEMQGAIQFKTEVYISMKEWLQEFQNQPCSHINLEVTVEKLATDIAKGK